jgi:hypothetical protein
LLNWSTSFAENLFSGCGTTRILGGAALSALR